ncbi:MAG: methyltransferase domain-containing protein [Algiphilus sp.]|uniref:class I SAM-dependent methyltransferase n=1 Tax=Algiphilus sp. TaxID=1872431 RepID=UPI002A68670A|nr:class I SAM-dependent methyltransferase [Pseudomonadota bacterium]
MTKPNDLYPEKLVGGYSRVDGTIEFYLRLGELVHSNHIVVDVGAGRGMIHTDRSQSIHARLMNFKGRCRKVIGVDIDPAVYQNTSLNEAHLFDGERLPLEDESADVIFSDWVLEHVEHPSRFVSEIQRVLKPGGWFCARTPNLWGYIGIATNAVPNTLHTKVLKVAQPERKRIDVFPTFYRMNSERRLRNVFPKESWQLIAYRIFSEPAYFGQSKLFMRAAQVMFRLTPPGLEPVLLVFARKT